MSKREIEDDDDSDDFGPMPETAEGEDKHVEERFTKKRKLRKLEFEHVYLNALPSAELYEKSYMHRDMVTHIAVSKLTDFVLTGSIDGHVKFWKKMPGSIEFVKHFQAHLGPIQSFELSNNEKRLATSSTDKTIKIFEILSFDMSTMISLDYIPSVAVWLSSDRIAVADKSSGLIRIYSTEGNSSPIYELNTHTSPVRCMVVNIAHKSVISVDTRGIIEYWDIDSYASSEGAPIKFKYKTDTDLYTLAKARTLVSSIIVSPSGDRFITTSNDKQIRVFDYLTGRLKQQYDESAQSYAKGGRNHTTACNVYDEYELGKNLAVERELESLDEVLSLCKPCFDESGHFLIYGSILGIKVLNLYTGRVVRILGTRESTERFLSCALYQGIPKVDTQYLLSKAGSSEKTTAELFQSNPTPDPTLFCTSFKRRRFYYFSTHEPDESTESRDVLNEAPREDERIRAPELINASAAKGLSRTAIIHTTIGDIQLKLFPDECPKTVENFVSHAKNEYYNNVMIHRVIKGFMIQTGDPLGDGTGGESIWGGEFEDEFHRNLRHDRPFTLSMANAGPNTNGSQFFITTVPTPWLDNKHTVFGRVTHGYDIVTKIENVKVNKYDKPLEPIRILSIETS